MKITKNTNFYEAVKSITNNNLLREIAEDIAYYHNIVTVEQALNLTERSLLGRKGVGIGDMDKIKLIMQTLRKNLTEEDADKVYKRDEWKQYRLEVAKDLLEVIISTDANITAERAITAAVELADGLITELNK